MTTDKAEQIAQPQSKTVWINAWLTILCGSLRLLLGQGSYNIVSHELALEQW